MRILFPCPLFLLLLSFALGVQAQTLPDATTLPRPPAAEPTLGPVTFEPLDLPGTAVVQDHQGFMWFAGGNGLYRYDGYTSIHYRHDPEDSTTLSFLRAESLYLDRGGTLWVGTFGGGLNRYDEATDSFTRFLHDPEDETSLSHDLVTAILEDSRGTLWVGTHGGLDRYDPLDRLGAGSSTSSGLPRATPRGQAPDTGTFSHYRHDPDDPTSLSNDQVRVLYEDRQGTLWVGTGSPSPNETPAGEGGLNRFDPTTGTFTRYLHDPEDETSLISNKVMSLYEDSRGTFWVGTAGDGLHTMDRAAGTFTRHRYDPNDPTKLSRPFLAGTQPEEGCDNFDCGGVTFIYEDRQGLLWIGGLGGGVNRYDPSTGSGQALETGAMTHHEAAPSGLGDNNIWTMMESHDGTLWIGTWYGLNKVVSSANVFTYYALDSANPTSYAPGVRSLHEDRDGMLWIGMQADGLYRFDRATGRFTHYVHDPADPASLGSPGVVFVSEGRDGALWLGGSRWIAGRPTEGTVSHFDRATGRSTHYLHDPADPASLSPGEKQAVLEDSQGRLWVGGNGLDLLDRATGAPGSGPGQGFIHHRHDPADPTSLSNNNAWVLLEDHEGTIWAGTNVGLNRYDDETAAFTRYLPGTTVVSLFEDAAGRFWVGTGGDGLHLFDRQTGTSTRYGLDDGLPSVGVAGLVEDDDGALWISTEAGPAGGSGWLSRFDPDRETFVNFDARDGLPGGNFNWRVAAKSRDGTLFFGGDGGFVAFNPQVATRASLRRGPKMALTGLRVFNEDVKPGASSLLRQPLHVAEEIRLSYDQNDFTVDYTGLSFRDSKGLHYQYTLENHDVGWVDAKGQRSARYSGLAPGSYDFRVRAIDSGGLRSEEDASLHVVILPPWWRTVWAYLLYGLFFIGGVYAADRFQRKRLIRQERERAAIEQAELRAEAAELQARATEAQAKALQAENERNRIALEKARELEEAHRHLKATQSQLVQSEKMASLGQLTAGIAHEIKNPLNFVNNFAEVNEELADELLEALHNGDDLEAIIADLKQNARVIAQHGRRADAIVHAMMQHASGGSGQRESTDINALVSEHIELAYHGKRAQVPDLTVKIERDLAADAGSVEVVPQEIGRVLLNLLGNAFDAVQEHAKRVSGDFAPAVTVSTRRIGGQVEIRVSDNGVGIPAGVQGRIFEPFFTTKPTGTGTGLGLSLSYDIVAQGHGGALTVESEEGEGATFIITLPVNQTEAESSV